MVITDLRIIICYQRLIFRTLPTLLYSFNMLGLILLILASLQLGSAAPSTPHLIDNFNSSMCSPTSIQSPPLSYTSFSIDHFVHNKFRILQSFPLKRYEFIDSDFLITEISDADEPFLRNQQTPVQIFDEYRVVIENYQLLTEREFQVTMVNPSSSLIFCVKQIYIDIPEIKRVEHRKLPFCINRKTKYPFNFKMYFQEMRNRVLKFGIFFVIDLKDTYSGKFIEQRLWGKEIVAKISHNWLKYTAGITVQPRDSNSWKSIVLSNPTNDDVNIDIFSSTNRLGGKGQEPTENRLSKIELRKGASVEINVQNKVGELFIHNLNNLKLENIKVVIASGKGFFIEPINIGILPSKKFSLETYLYVSNTLNQSVSITQIQLISKIKTIQIIPIVSSNQSIPGQTLQHPIAIIKICPGTGEDQLIRSTIKLSYAKTIQDPIKHTQTTETTFSYYQILNPLTNMQKRFFNLYKGYSKSKKRFQDTLFQIKNSLNIPIKLSNVMMNEEKFKISWVSEKREYIYPNHPNVLFGLEYIGEESLPLPATSELMLLEFNGNILIPVELVLYDKTLECKYLNVSNRCTSYQRLDIGNLRSSINNTRQFIISNPNPSPLKIYIKPTHINNHTKIKLLGPFPSTQNYTRLLNQSQQVISTLKYKMSLVFRFEINCNEAGYYSEIVNIVTDEENLNLEFTYRLSEGMLSLHPNPLIVINQYLPRNVLIYMVSTFSEEYQLLEIETNISSLTVKQANTQQIIKPNEVREINIQYSPTIIQTLEFSDILSLIHKSMMGQNTIGYIKVRTSQDLEQTIHTVVTNAIIRLLPQRHTSPISVIQKSMNNKLILKVANFYNLTIKFKVALIEPEFAKHPAQAKYVMEKYREKSSFYLCLSESVKSKLKLTSSIIRSLLHLDSSPIEVFIEALEDGRVFLQWHHKEQFKTYESLEKQIGKKVLSSIYTGSRNCFKGQSSLYFKQLFNTQQFIRILESGESSNFFQFMQREYENSINPSLVLEGDPFYKKLNLTTSSKCFFRFCNYIPIEYSQEQHYLQADEIMNISLSIRQSIQHLRPIAFVIINSIGRTEYDIIEFKSMKMAMTLETVLDNNKTMRILEITNDTSENFMPILLTPNDYKSGQIKGERSFTFKNIGDMDINVTSILFEDTYEPEVFEGFEIVRPEGFAISKGNTSTMDIRFKIGSVPNKPISVFFYSPSNYYFKLKLIVLSGGLNRSFTEPQYLYLSVGILLTLSTIYIGLILRIVIRQKQQPSMKSILPPKSQNSCLKKPLKKLDFTYINQLRQRLHPPPDPSQIQSLREQSIIKNIEQIQSKQSVQSRQSKEEQISIDDKSQIISHSNEIITSEKEDHEPYFPIIKKQIDSEEESLGSGSSLSDDIFAEINNFNHNYNYKQENSNSDKNENESNDSLKFYNAFLSGGPLMFKTRSRNEEFFDEEFSQPDKPED